MTVIRMRSCRGCGRNVQCDSTCICGTPHGKSLHKARARATGRNTQHWKKLRAAAIAAHPYCSIPGCTNTDLTVHHRTYPAVTTADTVVFCRSCHGRISQAEQERGH